MKKSNTSTHAYIERRPDVANGKAIISGTRIKVSQIALEYERLGWTPDQIADAHPHLTLAQIHDALSFYYENQPEIDAELVAEEKTAEDLRKLYPSKLPAIHAR